MIDALALPPVDRYRLLIAAVVPRPIAWITTADAAGLVNAAPFSFFQGVTANPPTLSVCIAHREPAKDTLANLRATGEAVVHLVPPGGMDEANRCGASLPHDRSEVEMLGLATMPSQRVRPPRLACAQVAFECRLEREIPVGDPPTSLCLLAVLAVHVDPAVARPDGLPDPHLLRAAARLGGESWLSSDGWQVVDLPRPRV